MNLIYVADPMCTWCYGFSASVDALLREPGAAAPLQLALLMGGLQPFTTTPLSKAHAGLLEAEWQHVAAATGEAFCGTGASALHSPGFRYDTEPASRAVVAVRSIWPRSVWRMFRALQRAFYADGRDITQAVVLADIAAEVGIRRTDFATAHASQVMRDAVRQEFVQARGAGLDAFPILLRQTAAQLVPVCRGYLSPAELRGQVEAIADAR